MTTPPKTEAEEVLALELDEVLYEWDRIPCIFTARLPSGGMVLAYIMGECGFVGTDYLVCPLSEDVLAGLKDGSKGPREALAGTRWIIRTKSGDSCPYEVRPVYQDLVSAQMSPGAALLEDLAPWFPESDVRLYSYQDTPLEKIRRAEAEEAKEQRKMREGLDDAMAQDLAHFDFAPDSE